MMAAKFEIRSPSAGQFTWVLVSQGRTLATGGSYGRRALAEKAIDALRTAAGGATVSDLTLKPAKTTAKQATAKMAAAKKATGSAKKSAPAGGQGRLSRVRVRVRGLPVRGAAKAPLTRVAPPLGRRWAVPGCATLASCPTASKT
jgi:uncharacterized protein YegP (UPF0339 family)